MSSSELVELIAPADDGVTVTISDHSFAPIESGVGDLSVNVEPGLYSVRYLTGSTVHQELVTVPVGKRRVKLPRPTLHFDSPAPLSAGTPVSETHLHAARQICGKVSQKLGSGAQLFVFVRDRDRRGRRSPLAGLTLHDQDGEQLLDLQDAAEPVRRDAKHPLWDGLTVAVEPGPYRLRVRTGAIGTFEQLVFVAGGWQTRLFLERRSYPGGAGGRTADLGDSSILMAPLGVGFDPTREDLRLTELARQALSTGHAVLADADLRKMLSTKFGNPMLGIYGAHLLVRREGDDDKLLATVCDNLKRLVPGHPDVAALGLLLADRKQRPFAVPPMLRASWQLIIQASAEHPELVPLDSLPARIAGSVYDSSTWLIWRALRKRRDDHAPTRPERDDIPVVELMNRLAAAVPEFGATRERAFEEMEPLDQDLLTFARGASASAPEAEEHTVLETLGMPRSAAQAKLLQIADDLDVTL